MMQWQYDETSCTYHSERWAELTEQGWYTDVVHEGLDEAGQTVRIAIMRKVR